MAVSYKELVNTRNALDKVLGSGSLQMDKFDDQQSLSSNSSSLFGGRNDTHGSVQLGEMQEFGINFNA